MATPHKVKSPSPLDLTESSDKKSNKWQKEDDIIYKISNNKVTNNIAAFDLVDTLVIPSSASQFFRDADDWSWSYVNTPKILNRLHADGWTVVIFSNQLRIKTDPTNLVMKSIIKDMLKELTFVPTIIMSVNKSSAKPKLTMWEKFLEQVPIEPSSASFFCGDKGEGVSDIAQYANDDVDVKFAKGIKLAYYDPMEIFGSNPDVISQLDLNIKTLYIMVGQQGSGKSTFAKKLLDRIEGETKREAIIIHRLKGKHGPQIVKNLKEGKSVIFDATDPDKTSRSDIISIGQELKIKTVVIMLLRKGKAFNAERTGKDKIPEVALRQYSAKFEMPDKRTEGFDVLLRVN